MTKGKEGFTIGLVPKFDIDNVGYTLWIKNNLILRVWIGISIAPEI